MTPIVTADVEFFVEIFRFMLLMSIISGLVISAFVAYDPDLSATSTGLMMLFVFPVACFATFLSVGIMLIPILIVTISFSIAFPQIIIGIMLAVSFAMASVSFLNDFDRTPNSYPLGAILLVPILWIATFFMACRYVLFFPVIVFTWFGEICQECLNGL